MKRIPDEYIRHVYWVDDDRLALIRNDLFSRGIPLRTARGLVCSPLSPKHEISVVPPGVWSETCARQGSWYRTSEKRGLSLIISRLELEDFEDLRSATIRFSDFIPPRLADLGEKRRLAHDPEIQGRIPLEWHQASEEEKRVYLRWVRRLGSEVDDYNVLLLSHTANHANFIRPRLFIRDRDEIIPYSIDRTAHLCSSCLELFQVLGGEFKRKLVAPCPGASLFAHLEADRYLLVESARARYKSGHPVARPPRP